MTDESDHGDPGHLAVLKELDLPLFWPDKQETSLPHFDELAEKLRVLVEETIWSSYDTLVEWVDWYLRYNPYYIIWKSEADKVRKAVADLGEDLVKLWNRVTAVFYEVGVVRSLFDDAEEWGRIRAGFSRVAAGLEPTKIHPSMRYVGTPGSTSQWTGRFAGTYLRELAYQQEAVRHYREGAGRAAAAVNELAKVGTAVLASWGLLMLQIVGIIANVVANRTVIGKIFGSINVGAEIRTISRLVVSSAALTYVARREAESKTDELTFLRDDEDGLSGYRQWPDPTNLPEFPQLGPDGRARAGAPVLDDRR